MSGRMDLIDKAEAIMAIVQTSKQRNLASKLVDQAVALEKVLTQVDALVKQYPHAGEFKGETFEGTALEHIDGADLITLIGAFDSLLNWFNEPGQFRRDIYRKVLP